MHSELCNITVEPIRNEPHVDFYVAFHIMDQEQTEKMDKMIRNIKNKALKVYFETTLKKKKQDDREN